MQGLEADDDIIESYPLLAMTLNNDPSPEGPGISTPDSHSKTAEDDVVAITSTKSARDAGADGHTIEGNVVQKRPRTSWKSYLWDTLDKSPEERRFLFKLDAVLITFASLGYLIKYLDQVRCSPRPSQCSTGLNSLEQVNINNAFVSGMQEDLGLFGNELNYMIACWTVGYVIGEIPR